MNRKYFIQKKIEILYEKFFRKLGIKKDGTFPKKSRWSFLRFPTYPLIGSKYVGNKNFRVMFIGLEIGKDENPEGGIIGFDEKRKRVEGKEKHNHHVYGMGVATIFLLKNLFKKNERTKIFKGKTKTYKDTFELAKKIKPNFNPLFHIAMTNCYKFVTINSERRTGSKDGKHISIDAEWDLLEEEVWALRPKFLVFESKKFTDDHWFKPLISEIKKQNKNTEVYISNHPSDRGLHSNTSKYLRTFKKI